MIQLLLGLAEPPAPFDAADALAIAVCHLHRMNGSGALPQRTKTGSRAANWRAYRPR
jgi:Holliday junction resolvasome RuvABC endonuclease subunit